MIREEDVMLGGPASLARVLTLARPEKKNAISTELAETLADAIDRASDDETVRAVILSAEGDVFAAGGDLDEIAQSMSGEGAARRLEIGMRLQRMEACTVPVLAAVNGDVYGGGCELVLLTDIVLAEAHVRFSFRHARMGLAPAWGGTGRLIERTSLAFATRALLTAESINANNARVSGLVSDVVPTGAALAKCITIANEIARSSRAGVTGVKASIQASRRAARKASSSAEAEIFQKLFGGPAHREAMEAAKRGRT